MRPWHDDAVTHHHLAPFKLLLFVLVEAGRADGLLAMTLPEMPRKCGRLTTSSLADQTLG